MYLSYSGFKSYTSCPRMYWHQYIGKTKLVIPENAVNSLYGSIVGNLFETFYSAKLWRETGVEQKLLGLVPSHFLKVVAKETREGGGRTIRWKPEDSKANYASPDALLDDVRVTIPRGLSIIRQHRLLGPTQSEAEVKLDHTVDGHTIGGRADFLIKRIAPYLDLVLIDGKGSKWRDKYVDVRQLKWYAMLHRLKHGFMPDKLGFVFWRFEAERAMDWVDFSEAELVELQGAVLSTMQRIEETTAQLATLGGSDVPSALRETFPPSPGERCRLCAFRLVCPEGQHFDSVRVPIPDGTGVEDVVFNG